MFNKKWEAFKESLKNKRVALLGAGVSNRPLIPLFADLGAEVFVSDKNPEIDREKVSVGRNVNFVLGDSYLENIDADLIFRSPGMRFDLPQLQSAVEKGAILTSEMEVFFDVCPGKIIAVTGSDGKTTTTTLIDRILKEAGFKTHLGGNIGTPLLAKVDEISTEDMVVLELSSFQLHTMKKSPHIGVITNITPNHLDVHKSYEEYIEAKANIMRYQGKQDILVTNLDCEITKNLGEDAKGILKCFSSKNNANVFVRDNKIFKGGEEIIDISRIKLPGAHNVENYMAAICATDGYVSKADICAVAESFGGVEHRIELVREFEGVKYYNSSIDSSPNRSKATLNVFNQKVIMIAGGKDKGIPYDEIGPVIAEKVKNLILIGKTADKIQEAVKNTGADVPVSRCETYEQAVEYAREVSDKGDIVVLSPASTSFDMFKNFEERGNIFKKLVNELE